MAIELPALPYVDDALEPHISERTIGYHYGRHHAGYVSNLNGLIGGTDGCISASIDALVAAKRTWSLPEIAPGSVCPRSAERSAW